MTISSFAFSPDGTIFITVEEINKQESALLFLPTFNFCFELSVTIVKKLNQVCRVIKQFEIFNNRVQKTLLKDIDSNFPIILLCIEQVFFLFRPLTDQENFFNENDLVVKTTLTTKR